MKRRILFGMGLAALCANASATDIGVGLRASTLGLGAEVSISMLNGLNLRIPVSGFNYNDDLTEDDIRYDADLELLTVGLLADYHVFGGGFHVTGGVASNGNELKLLASEATGNERFQVGNQTYVSDPNDPFELRAGLDFNAVAPYLGIGWGNAASGQGKFYFKFEAGALFQGSPQASTAASGSACNTSTETCALTSFDVQSDDPRAQQFRVELERERRAIEEEIDEFDIYPVVSLSIGYRFLR
ncbi:hypothetical protein [Algiphilus sp.]|uniref:hypothetical protein n=1 Tax=Algiphilus sp. TaxID=1872431 RepID=UPI0032EDABB6